MKCYDCKHYATAEYKYFVPEINGYRIFTNGYCKLKEKRLDEHEETFYDKCTDYMEE